MRNGRAYHRKTENSLFPKKKSLVRLTPVFVFKFSFVLSLSLYYSFSLSLYLCPPLWRTNKAKETTKTFSFCKIKPHSVCGRRRNLFTFVVIYGERRKNSGGILIWLKNILVDRCQFFFFPFRGQFHQCFSAKRKYVGT